MIELDFSPDRGKLRVFGATSFVVVSAVGAWVFFRHHFAGFDIEPHNARVSGLVLWGVAAVSGLLAAALPAALRPLYLGLSLLTFPIGVVMSIIVLGVIYYGMLTPVGIFFRLTGRDVLSRKLDPGLRSYWTRRTVNSGAKRYFRQF